MTNRFALSAGLVTSFILLAPAAEAKTHIFREAMGELRTAYRIMSHSWKMKRSLKRIPGISASLKKQVKQQINAVARHGADLDWGKVTLLGEKAIYLGHQGGTSLGGHPSKVKPLHINLYEGGSGKGAVVRSATKLH